MLWNWKALFCLVAAPGLMHANQSLAQVGHAAQVSLQLRLDDSFRANRPFGPVSRGLSMPRNDSEGRSDSIHLQTDSDTPKALAEAVGPERTTIGAPSAEPGSISSLFGTTLPKRKKTFWDGRITGFFQNSTAYTFASPAHLSLFQNILDLATEGHWGERVKWHAEVRGTYDGVYDLTNFYPESVGDAERFEGSIRQTYADISAGNWHLRLGRQQIVWGETVGLFFADVVSAKDLRQFILPDVDMIRIPQWATRTEYFKGNFHGELVWIPFTTVDEIGVPGSEFYPYPPPPPPGYASIFRNEVKPNDSPANSGVGIRGSYLYSGWDTALFYYTSIDEQAAFERRVVTQPQPAFVFTPIHGRIHQFGATTARTFGNTVFRAEAVYTLDRLFNVTDPSNPTGLVHQNYLNYVLGLEYFGPHSLDLDAQFFQFWFPHHDPHMTMSSLETGYTLRLSTSNLNAVIKPEVLLIGTLNRNDWLLKAKLTWEFHRNWSLSGGVDIFHGPPNSLFGQYDNKDRVFTELHYSF